MSKTIQQHTLTEIGFLRLPQIIGDKNSEPPIPAIIPVSKSNWWAGVRAGRYPQPKKIGVRCTVWSVESIRNYIESVGA